MQSTIEHASRGGWASRRTRYASLAILSALAFGLSSGVALGQFNEKQVRPQINVEDKSDDIHAADSKVYVMSFNFKEPRLITVDIPGRGRKLCWYLWYQVVNRTGEPRLFIPRFELVTLDKPGVFKEFISPVVQEAIRRVEDPTGYLNIKNSVTISREPIPVSKPDGAPQAITGVVIWDDVNPDANRFSIFVGGLSNGISLAEVPPNNKQDVREKTLQLNFRRVGDRFYQHSGEIRWVPPAEWIYRSTGVSLDGPGIAPKQPAPAGKDAAAVKAPRPDAALADKKNLEK